MQHAAEPQQPTMSAQLQSQSEAALHVTVQPTSPMPDIDSADADDPLNACDYVTDIFSYWRRVEPLYRVGPEYMSRQVSMHPSILCIRNFAPAPGLQLVPCRPFKISIGFQSYITPS